AHRLGRERHLEPDVEGAPLALARVVEIGQRIRIAVGADERRGPERLEGVERDDPRRDRGREVLREKRAERLVLPRLDVARGPVVQEARAEEVVLCGSRRNRRAERVAGADEEAHLELVVQTPRRTKDRLGGRLWL